MEIQVPEILSRALIDDAKEYSETDVVNQPATDQCGGTVTERRHPCLRVARIVRARCGPAARAPGVLLVMKPNQPVVLQVLINREDRDQRNWLCRHRREQRNPMHRYRSRQKQILRHIQRLSQPCTLYLSDKPSNR